MSESPTKRLVSGAGEAAAAPPTEHEHMPTITARPTWALLLLALAMPVLAKAQYFGKNKPRYERFDWTTYRTPHFDIYNTLEPTGEHSDSIGHAHDAPPERLAWIGALSEDWYARHSAVLRDTLSARNPMLLYDHHADFQQTNAVSGAIGTGTGGVTEAFKNRVVYPFARSNHQTDHVLGHELVHAFQYDLVLRGDSTNIKNLENLPLWMVEGLAEYLSIGRVDAHTAMWMRDAVLHDDVPTIKQLNNPKYFPYRWGQAWWSFVTGLRGDAVIRPYFEETAKVGLEAATRRVLDMSLEHLSTLWVSTIENTYRPHLDARPAQQPPGKRLIDAERGGGAMNIAPVVSPDGRFVIYLSERNLLSVDLFLADARSGKVIRQVTRKQRAGHIDDLAFVESAGTWSPRSDRFAYVGVSKGRNVLIVRDVQRGKTVAEYTLPGVEAFDNPAWSPDGGSIVVSGLVQGQVDLYQFFPESGRVVQLTDTYASELLASWDAAGERLVFAQDRPDDGERLSASAGFDLAVLDVATGETTVLDVFAKADNLNPNFDHEGDVVFVSNQDGYRDLYRYDLDEARVYRLTELRTGVSGITAYAPAVSASPRRDRITYTVLADGEYAIYSGRRERFLNVAVADTAVTLAAAHLPTVNKKAPLVVDAGLAARTTNLSVLDHDSTTLGDAGYGYVPLENPFKLDYVGGGAGVGTSIGNPGLGTQFGAAGGVSALFGDVLGNQQVFAGASLNGQLIDFSAQLAYVNRAKPLGWGVSFSHIPYRTGALLSQGVLDTLGGGGGRGLEVVRYDLLERRVFEDRLGGFVDYPFSRTLRAEAGASFALYAQRQDVNALYYDGFGQLVYQERERDRRVDLPGLRLGSVSAALVGDNAAMGPVGPLQGHRFRLGVEQVFGTAAYTQSTVDVRGYHRLRPVTFALRAVHYGRHGLGDQASGGLLFPFYLGRQGFVRGLGNQGELARLGGLNDFNFGAVVGNNLGLVNAEVRLPLTGPKRLALLPFKFMYTELTAFVDGGVAYDRPGELSRYFRERGATDAEGQPVSPSADFASLSRPIFSAGVSLRANVLGALVVEPYYARVLNLEGSAWQFGLNLLPGW